MKNSRRRPGTIYINDHPLYATWSMIKQRCYNQNHPSYHLYGAKGITMCDRWKNDFSLFVHDIGERPSDKHTIDRYPNKNGDYSPNNVRWATWHEQNKNRNRWSKKIGLF